MPRGGFRRRAFLATVGTVTVPVGGCVQPPAERSATRASPTKPSIKIVESDQVAEEHQVRITATVTTSTVTEEHPARVRVSTTDTGESRYIQSMRRGLHFHPQYGGETSDDPPGLVLLGANDEYTRTDGKWQFEPYDGGQGGAGLAGVELEAGETISNDYAVLDDATVSGYFSPGTYRFEAPVVIKPDAEEGPPSGIISEFTWGFSVKVEKE